MVRSVDAARQDRWDRAASGFWNLLTEAGLTEDVVSESVGIIQIVDEDRESFMRKAKRNRDFWDISDWQLADTGKSEEDEAGSLFALPVPGRTATAGRPEFLFVDTHASLIDWWLLSAWRCAGLIRALEGQEDPVAAAALGRSLLESAAALWVDTTSVSDLWARAKSQGRADPQLLATWYKMYSGLEVITDGGKFTDRAPSAKETWGRFEKFNVLTYVEKLHKVHDEDVQSIYEWLCNVVHPSLGTMVLYSDQWMNHVSGSHRKRSTRRKTLSDALVTSSDRSAPAAIADGTAIAAEVATVALDVILRIADDVCLTCKVSEFSMFDTWRKLAVPKERNGPCPCRSGRKVKQCPHDWTSPAPRLPERASSSAAHGR